MNWLGLVLGVLVVIGWLHLSYERSRCSATHERWGRCTRKPGHWPHPHSGWRGGHWR